MATTYDKASLVMIPSGVKEDKLYSIKPTDGSGDFTFSRGTDTATRVNASGLIEKERSNQILQSNTFNTTWGPSSSISVTGGQSGYDGTNDAWLLKRSDASARYINQNITLGSSVYTYSVYAKAESENWIFIWSYNGSGSVSAYFDLSGSGAVGTTSGVIDANIESVGGGWFRCSITYSNNIQAVRIYPAVADNTTTGGVTDAGVYIQDSQIETSLVAQPYIETTTAAVYEGITDNLPRLDYSGGASCPSLLLEGSRTNVIPQSEYIADWSQTNATTASNQATSPEGVNNASLSTATGSGAHAPYDTLAASVTSGANYTMSIFYKKGTTNYLRFEEGYSGIGIDIDIDAESATPRNGATNANIEDYGNSWYRASFGFTGHGSGSSQIVVYIKNSSDQTSYTASGESVYLYGAQLEAGSYPTSYIPTYGTSASRAEDVCGDGGDADTFNDSEGVLYAEFSTFINAGGGTRRIQIQNAGSTQYVRLQVANGDGTLYAIVDNGSQQYLYNDASFDSTAVNKVALKYAPNNYALYVNGVKVDSQSSGSTFANGVLTETNFSAASPFYGNIKQTLVFPTALTDAECIALTTI